MTMKRCLNLRGPTRSVRSTTPVVRRGLLSAPANRTCTPSTNLPPCRISASCHLVMNAMLIQLRLAPVSVKATTYAQFPICAPTNAVECLIKRTPSPISVISSSTASTLPQSTVSIPPPSFSLISAYALRCSSVFGWYPSLSRWRPGIQISDETWPCSPTYITSCCPRMFWIWSISSLVVNSFAVAFVAGGRLPWHTLFCNFFKIAAFIMAVSTSVFSFPRKELRFPKMLSFIG